MTMKRFTSLITSLLLCAMLVTAFPQTACSSRDNSTHAHIEETVAEERNPRFVDSMVEDF